MTPSRLLLIAQSPVWRFALRMVVESSWPEVESAEADHSLAAYGAAPRFNPDLAIIQDALPGVSGMIAARMICQLAPQCRVIVLTDDVDLTVRAVGGAEGMGAILPSAAEPDELVDAIRSLDSPSAEQLQTSPLDIALLDGLSRGLSFDAVSAATGASATQLSVSLAALHERFDAADTLALIVNAVGCGWIDMHVKRPGSVSLISFAVAA